MMNGIYFCLDKYRRYKIITVNKTRDKT